MQEDPTISTYEVHHNPEMELNLHDLKFPIFFQTFDLNSRKDFLNPRLATLKVVYVIEYKDEEGKIVESNESLDLEQCTESNFQGLNLLFGFNYERNVCIKDF